MPKSSQDDVPAKSEKASSDHSTKWQKMYGFLGFKKGYNFPLFSIFAGAMFGFSLARTEYLSTANYAEGAAPGEWYWYHSGHYRVGIVMHLASVIPAGLLMVWQFIPIIRQKFILFHRINGYTVSILLVVGVASALMLARRSFGGIPSTQAGIGLLAIIVILSLGMALYNINRLQIDQHRAWMLRTVFYCGTIITLRIIMIIAAQILPLTGDYYSTFSCGELATLNSPRQFRNRYPQCFVSNESVSEDLVAVRADFNFDKATVGSALELGFAMGIWLAIFLHVVGVEIYLTLTPAESERLRVVSYEKQLKAGFKHPGSAGLTVDRWGDAAPWRPKEVEQGESV